MTDDLRPGTSRPASSGTADAPPPEPTDGERRSRFGFLGELPALVLIAFILALLLKTFLVQAFFIPSASMEPTLRIGDRVLVNKVVHEVREPHRGEVVVFSQDDGLLGEPEQGLVRRLLSELGSGLGVAPAGEKDFIKRIIGLPGDTVEMRQGVVLVNGEPLPEAPAEEGGYLSTSDLTDFGPVQVPLNEYFMMGDNRPNSADSRYGLGTIPREDIVGRAFVVIWPIGNAGTLPIPDLGEIPTPAEAPVIPGLGDDGGADAAPADDAPADDAAEVNGIEVDGIEVDDTMVDVVPADPDAPDQPVEELPVPAP